MSTLKTPKPGKPENGKAVGYKNPPAEHRFQPGKSGNPTGLHHGSKNKFKGIEGQFQQIILEEANRKVDINENGKCVSMSAAQTAFRVLMTKAMKGDFLSSKLVLTLLKEAEVKQAEGILSLAKQAYTYKEEMTAFIQMNKKHNIAFDMPTPHPDHVHIDYETLEVEISGPLDRKQLSSWIDIINEIAKMEVEAMLDGNSNAWIRKAMQFTEEDSIPKPCKHMRKQDQTGELQSCKKLKCRARAEQRDDEVMTMKYYKLFRERIPSDDPLWIEYGPALKREWIDYFFYYGPRVQINKQGVSFPKCRSANFPNFTQEQHMAVQSILNASSTFRAFMREKLKELMGDKWYSRLDAVFHSCRDIELDRMRYEYETGIFDQTNYVLKEGELSLFEDEGFLKVYMSWQPLKQSCVEVVEYLEQYGC